MTEVEPKGGDWRIAATVIAVLTLFRFWASASIPLSPDETYYWLWSRVPAAGYFDHPPMVAWWIWASTALFGDNAFGVRALSVVSTGLVSYAVFATARNLNLESETLAEKAGQFRIDNVGAPARAAKAAPARAKRPTAPIKALATADVGDSAHF